MRFVKGRREEAVQEFVSASQEISGVCPHCQLKVEVCKSCGAKILWGRTTEDRSIPLDVEIRVVLVGPVGDWRRRILEVRRGHETHFASCPDAKAWRGT